jgi:RimJ/RimL family protein N-acetyltransferase
VPFSLTHRPRFLRGSFIDEPVDAPVIRTSRLVLRPHRLDDAEDWYRLQSDPEVIRYLPWPLRTRAESERHLHARTRHTRLWQSDDFLALAVELDGHLIGDVSLHLRTVQLESRTAEIGWIIDPRQGHRGYGTEASRAMLALAFDTLQAKLVLAVIDERNEPSLALARRLAFVPAGTSEGSATLVTTSEEHALSKHGHRPKDGRGRAG